MYIELHILQNFAPSNLNRSDTGSPKDCEFGGYRRGRISSQCLKRAMRDAFKQQCLFSEEAADKLAVRTKRLIEEVSKRLVDLDATGGRAQDDARRVVETAAGGVGLKMKDSVKTQYLLFLGKDEISEVAKVCDQHYDALLAAGTTQPVAGTGTEGGKKVSAKEQKKDAKKLVSPEVSKAFESALNGGKAADLALFGRMLADLPHKNIDAASQVAHALSTNKISMEFDFYTAVDDLKPEDTEGADMLGTIEFNSACFYRYLNVDTEQLKKNLQADAELTDETIGAFVRAAIAAVPTGKQNSHAAQQRPSFIFAVARRGNRCSLANAFVKPVAPDAKNDLVGKSIGELARHYGELTGVYGEADVIDKCFVALGANDYDSLTDARVESVDQLVTRMRAAAQQNGGDDGSNNSPQGA